MIRHHLRNELWKLLGKRRTYIGFGMLLMAQVAVTIVFRFTGASRAAVRALESNGYEAASYLSALTVAVVMLFPIAYLLMPLYVALVGGDMVAKEAEDGTLRMILARPVSRARILVVKWVAGCVFSLVLVGMLGLSGLGVASLFFPQGGLFVFLPGEIFTVLEPGPGLGRYFAAHAVLCLKAVTVLSLGFLFSCMNVKPAAATILALSVLFANAILIQIPFFREIQHWFLTYHLNLWQTLFAQPIPWWRVAESSCLLLGFNASFLILGLVIFQARDIKT
ncbi:MAG: ABC transporter permease [Limisphaerales bacterium]